MTEDPRPVEAEAHQRGRQVGRHEHGELRRAARLGGADVQGGQGPGGEREADGERDQAPHLVPRGVPAPPDAERHPPVHRGVGHGRQQQADGVRGLRGQDAAQEQVQQHVGHGAGHADQDEAHQLGGEAPAGPARAGQLGDADRATGQAGAEPHDAAQVTQGRGDDVDPRVGVVDPVHRDLMDAQPGPLREHEQFRVEEPRRIGGERQQRPGRVGAQRLEPALRVGEARAEGRVQQQVVAAGDDLPLGAPRHPRAARQPGSDRHIAVPRHQRCDQRQQRVQVRRQVYVHVGHDVGVAARPDRAQRPAAPGPPDMGGADQREFLRQVQGLSPGAVGAAIVGDSDARSKREAVITIGAQPPDGRPEVTFLVADRDHDLYLRLPGDRRRPRAGPAPD